MSCGIKTEIVSVTEPEKCEYLFKLQTPAVCPVLESEAEGEGDAEEQEKGQSAEGVQQEGEEHTRKHDEL